MTLTRRDPDQYRLHAEVCKVLTEPKRLMFLDALRGGEQTVGELAEAIAVSLPNASQHLAVMRAAGLVESRRAGTTIRYRLAEPTIVEACDVIQRIVERRMAGGRPNGGPVIAAVVPAPGRPTLAFDPSSAASAAGGTPQPAPR